MAVILCLAQPAQATNTFFMLGDSFFHSRLTQEFCDEMNMDDSSLEFRYARPARAPFMGCGYAGVPNLVVEDVDPRFTTALRELYEELRYYYSRETVEYQMSDGLDIRETNGFHILIYNKDFDLDGFPIGLKYNETWPNPPESAFGDATERTHLATDYESFVPGEKAVILDWLYGPKIESLKVTIPDGLPWGMVGYPLEEPARIKAGEIRCIIIPDGRIKAVYKERNRERFWEVTPDGKVKEYVWKHTKLELQNAEDRFYKPVEPNPPE